MSRIAIALLSLFFTNTTFAQTEWTKHAVNPVLTKSSSLDWDMFAAADPSVIKDGDTLKIWYAGGGVVPPDTVIAVRIGYAWSLDGIHWTKYPENPVVSPTSGEWDSLAIETVTVIKDTSAPVNERYRMWYGGSDDPIYGLYDLGYAFSADGINWSKHPANPVLVAGSHSSWENAGPEGPTVIKDGDTLKMWYAAVDTVPDRQPTDYHGSIGYAWSMDGANWTKHPNNPVLVVGNEGSWDGANIQDPFVMKIGNVYHLWYSGFPEWIDGTTMNGRYQIGYAQSSDGIHWTKSANNPVLPRGAAGSWDHGVAGFPTIIWDGSLLRMWYTGLDTISIPPWPMPYFWDIGYATAPLIVTAVNEQGSDVPSDFLLSQNYPNPFNPETTIQYRLTKAGNVTLRIYNLLGQAVRTLVNKNQSSRSYSVVWDGKNDLGEVVTSGMYFYKLKLGEAFIATRKMLLLR